MDIKPEPGAVNYVGYSYIIQTQPEIINIVNAMTGKKRRADLEVYPGAESLEFMYLGQKLWPC